jgi:hypothetical protein
VALRQARLIAGALLVGLLTASVVLAGLAFAQVVPASRAVIAPMAGFVALAFPTSVLVGIAVRSSMLQQARLSWLRDGGEDSGDSLDRFEEAYARASTLQSATLEGFGLLGAVSALVTGELLFLVAPAVAVVAIGVVFPTRAKFRVLLDRLTKPADERELRLIEALRQGDA